ncbi:mannose-6-phosphate isomerase, class I [Microbacterium candidum]|uniref:mannose-6-phosphate isomerase n=1 Tax=Microbacterium candidum TaxID=3041922 RepID=A0ABT7N4B6_9MICO|nr:mannose-6-phosphate isomerase, class I [Microbacterium sp. ASV49]MDL9981544.1 mannose-6-phosphate isomerase, class I [Microbacterium sp. ASV49]
MAEPTLILIDNDPRDYAWGIPGGISRLLGRADTDAPEAELWLGAHPLSPSRIVGEPGLTDLHAWEQSSGSHLAFLLKILAADHPLSLQAHPTPDQAAEGFAREESEGIPRDAAHRNYKDPSAKPEVIVALEDGFEALCGFRPVGEVLAVIDALELRYPDPVFGAWRERVESSVERAFTWLLTPGVEQRHLVTLLTDIAETHPRGESLLAWMVEENPGDAGIPIALMLNHVTLNAGEALWLPAGNIHAYLRGIGVEIMGPSDNVLRGGFTPKHVDVAELQRVLDFTAAPMPLLKPERIDDAIVAYRPPVGFELYAITGDTTVELAAPGIAAAVDGAFEIVTDGERMRLPHGSFALIANPATLRITGTGRLFIAAGR